MTSKLKCWLMLVMVLAMNMFWSVMVWAQEAGALPVTEAGALAGPGDPAVLIQQAGGLVNLAKTGQWLMFSFIAIKVIWGLLEYAPIKKRLGQYGMEINILLGAIAGCLAMVVGGATWMEAGLILMTGPAADSAHDLVDLLWSSKKKAAAEADKAEGK